MLYRKDHKESAGQFAAYNGGPTSVLELHEATSVHCLHYHTIRKYILKEHRTHISISTEPQARAFEHAGSYTLYSNTLCKLLIRFPWHAVLRRRQCGQETWHSLGSLGQMWGLFAAKPGCPCRIMMAKTAVPVLPWRCQRRRVRFPARTLSAFADDQPSALRSEQLCTSTSIISTPHTTHSTLSMLLQLSLLCPLILRKDSP